MDLLNSPEIKSFRFGKVIDPCAHPPLDRLAETARKIFQQTP